MHEMFDFLLTKERANNHACFILERANQRLLCNEDVHIKRAREPFPIRFEMGIGLLVRLISTNVCEFGHGGCSEHDQIIRFARFWTKHLTEYVPQRDYMIYNHDVLVYIYIKSTER